MIYPSPGAMESIWMGTQGKRYRLFATMIRMVIDYVEALPHTKELVHTLATPNDRIRTKDKLSYKDCNTCPLCQQTDETSDHHFFNCAVSKPLWDKVRS